jgi:hypothetical protein
MLDIIHIGIIWGGVIDMKHVAIMKIRKVPSIRNPEPADCEYHEQSD